MQDSAGLCSFRQLQVLLGACAQDRLKLIIPSKAVGGVSCLTLAVARTAAYARSGCPPLQPVTRGLRA
eukprot:9177821-Alexandrium_andersonii.AAC.1